MRLLFFGDIVGRGGRELFVDRIGDIRAKLKADFVVVNGENAAGGFGITEAIFNELIDAGADVVTLGNHAWAQREALVFIERERNLLRPVNFPPGTPGAGAGLFAAANGGMVLVMNVMGQVMMEPLDSPFAAVQRELAACPLGEGCDAVIIDMHAEATSEKMAMGHFADGRVSLVVGTHTHVPTSDYRIMSGGTAYMSDVGMCGDYDTVIGMDKEEPVNRFVRRIATGRFTPGRGEAALSGVLVETDDASGLARRIGPVRMGAGLEPAWPDF
jgi:metallophosphoesterase (TIGR00282 family)